ncbi:MAG: hypothetical protein ACPGID_09705, partial [Rubricella sp.]
MPAILRPSISTSLGHFSAMRSPRPVSASSASKRASDMVKERSAHASGPPGGRNAMEAAKLQAADVLLLDTAGRLHVDEALMAEMKAVSATAS